MMKTLARDDQCNETVSVVCAVSSNDDINGLCGGNECPGSGGSAALTGNTHSLSDSPTLLIASIATDSRHSSAHDAPVNLTVKAPSISSPALPKDDGNLIEVVPNTDQSPPMAHHAVQANEFHVLLVKAHSLSDSYRIQQLQYRLGFIDQITARETVLDERENSILLQWNHNC